ncbi:MAG: 3-phosphoshikimate 1-carboxyvinyltransferase [Deltaproteobacteria bacterium]|nr:3-phosphoshikimate 1-carboxyvinyltransferase [Deltaproteobacteria bacterium]
MNVVCTVPGSKSVTQRALVLAALADGPSELRGALDCDDSRRLREALRALGARIEDADPAAWRVTPGPLRVSTAPLECGNAGTALRFLAALALLIDDPLTLDGDEHLRRRPLGDLADALATLGVAATWRGRPGCPPVTLRRTGQPGDAVTVESERSSQFASALLLVAPRLPAGLSIRLSGPVVSRPYLALTVECLRGFGVAVEDAAAGTELRVAPGGPRGTSSFVEGDWSSAAFLLAAARIAGRALRLANLRDDSAQGDRAIVELLAGLDRPAPRTFDLRDCPDLLPPLAAAAAFAPGVTTISGVAHARVKESDRLAVLAEGFRRAGVRVGELPDGLRLEPGDDPGPATLEPHDDHRMAMAFGLLGLRRPGLRVSNPGCVGKSFPGFWDELERLR